MSTTWTLSLTMENVPMMTKKTSRPNGILSTLSCNNVDIRVPSKEDHVFQLAFTPKLVCQLAVLIVSVEWLTVAKRNVSENASTQNPLIVKNVLSTLVNQLSSNVVVSPKVTFHQLKSLSERNYNEMKVVYIYIKISLLKLN